MTIERLSVLVMLATIANLFCVVFLGIATYYNVRNYGILRRLQARTVPDDNEQSSRPTERYDSFAASANAPKEATVRARERVTVPRPKQPIAARTERVELDVPDTGQAEWTGPVIPYIPADRKPATPPNDPPARTRERAPVKTKPATVRTERHDVRPPDVPDNGQAEWTGPVIPYVPADRKKPSS